MNLFENVLHTLFDGIRMLKDIKISGKSMTAKIDPNVRVKVQFVSTDYQSQYDALLISVDGRGSSYAHMNCTRFSEILGNLQDPKLGPVPLSILESDGEVRWNLPVSDQDLKKISIEISEYFDCIEEEFQYLRQEAVKLEVYESELYQMFGHHPDLSMLEYHGSRLCARTSVGGKVTIDLASQDAEHYYSALGVISENPNGKKSIPMFFPFSYYMGDKQHQNSIYIDGEQDIPQWNKYIPLRKKLAMANSVIECVLKDQRSALV